MEDYRTKEQIEREQLQNEFFQDVKDAINKDHLQGQGDNNSKKKYRLVAYKQRLIKRKPGEGTLQEQMDTTNDQEYNYQQKKNAHNNNSYAPNKTNPNYQSPKSKQQKNPVNEAIKTGGVKVRKVLGN